MGFTHDAKNQESVNMLHFLFPPPNVCEIFEYYFVFVFLDKCFKMRSEVNTSLRYVHVLR